MTLAGLGADGFEKAVKGLLALHQVLGNGPDTKLEDWTPKRQNGMLTLEFWNRYFSTAKEADDDTVVTMSASIDPFSILRNRTENAICLADNQVHYYERQRILRGGKTYVILSSKA